MPAPQTWADHKTHTSIWAVAPTQSNQNWNASQTKLREAICQVTVLAAEHCSQQCLPQVMSS